MIIFNQNENHIKALSVSVGQGAIEWESLENILQMKISVAKFQAWRWRWIHDVDRPEFIVDLRHWSQF